ncbi:hypothetical protein [Desulfovibrio falkowii]|uniref:hypothetical protein n=1 Tax=Desulfovibrio falkowii TaxID=3136602 RepID=UPI0038B338C6
MPPFVLAVNNFFFNPPKFFSAALFRAVCSFSRTREAYAPFSQPCQLLSAGSANFLRRAQAQSVPVSRNGNLPQRGATVNRFSSFFSKYCRNKSPECRFISQGRAFKRFSTA